jgi:NADPH:quinone reductase-like Zn-dependent oxidoreductase
MTTLMQAAVVRRYGGPEAVQVESVPTPTVRPGEVLVRVHASPVTAADVRLRSAIVPRGYGLLVRLGFGLLRPRSPIPGLHFAGTVADVAKDVTPFRLGDRVFGIKGFRGGAHAEFLTMPASGVLLPLPESLTFEEGAAFFFGGLTAADFLIDKANLQPGESLLVLGATGSVGSAALSLARHLNLTVTAVTSTANLALARTLGAHDVIDYRTEPLRGTYDGILDVMGTLPYAKAKAFLKPGGRLMPMTGTLLQHLGATLRPRRGAHRITTSTTGDSLESARRLLAIHTAGGYRPLVGTCLPFSDIQHAHRIASTWHKQGNLVLQWPSGVSAPSGH